MSKYPVPLQQLIASLKLLPGVGTKTAERFAFHLLTTPSERLYELSQHLATLHEKVVACSECHCLMDHDGCAFCSSGRRDTTLLCIVSSPKDVYALEETHLYRGLYHVLGGLLSPLDGRSEKLIKLPKIVHRIQSLHIQEVIIALDSTLEGDATALYLKEHLAPLNIQVSRLAHGLPMGSPLEYVDGGTLTQAFTGRKIF